MSWQNLSHEERRIIYHSLKGRVAGLGWYYSHLYSVPERDIKRVKFRLIMHNLHRSFRYLILNETIRGTRLGLKGQQDRLRWRQCLIKIKAKRIAADTGVSFEKVHPELMRRMSPYID
jgi:hypothetical protein